MSDGLTIHCGAADTLGRRLVMVTLGENSHRHRFDTDSQFHRQQFREKVVSKFGLGEDSHEWIEQEILRVADAEDECGDGGHSPVLTQLSKVTPEEINWLWPQRLALGKISLVCGDPGVNKSFFLLDLAARISLGSRWPDCDEHAPLGGSVLLAAEDGLADTVVPRLIASGADLTRIAALSGVKATDATGEYQRQIDLGRDLDVIEKAVDQVEDCRLVGIDPVSCFMGAIDGHSNTDVRRVLGPLAEMAARRMVAVVCVTHLRKSEGAAVYRTMGSLAFAAASRAVWAIVKDKKDPDQRRRLFLPVKNNIGGDQAGLSFELSTRHGDGIPCIVWGSEPVRTTADEAMAPEKRKPGPETTERDDAALFLREALATGPRAVRDIEQEAREAHSISKRTLDRARQDIGVEAFREKVPGPWLIQLPTTPPTMPQALNGHKPGDLGSLGPTPGKYEKFAYARDKDAMLPGVAPSRGGLPDGDGF